MHSLPIRSEEQQFEASGAAQRRQEAARRAEERAEAEAAKLREAARAGRASAREAELAALYDINLEADRKLLELRVAKAVARRERVSDSIATRAKGLPVLRWRPKVGGLSWCH